MRKILTLTIAATALMAAGSALASDALRYDDLDLSNPAGKAELERRIDAVALSYCRNRPQTGTRIGRSDDSPDMRECRADIADQLRSEVAKRRH